MRIKVRGITQTDKSRLIYLLDAIDCSTPNERSKLLEIAQPNKNSSSAYLDAFNQLKQAHTRGEILVKSSQLRELCR